MKHVPVNWLDNMNILFLGDIVGASGRDVVRQHLSSLKERYEIDLVVANGENSAHGKGITQKIYRQLLDMGIDVITMGNHTFSKNDIFQFIDNAERLVRPANMEPLAYGQHTTVIEVKGKRVAISNLCGEIWMHDVVDSPFFCMEDILDSVDADYYLVDLHAEATSEKIAFTYAFAGRVQAVVGTHTHVQTADEKILPKGTGYITDIGMTGPKNSVIGMEISASIKRFETTLPERYKIATGECIFNGIIVDIDDDTNKVKEIKRINLK